MKSWFDFGREKRMSRMTGESPYNQAKSLYLAEQESARTSEKENN
jgi:hypothetical protein